MYILLFKELYNSVLNVPWLHLPVTPQQAATLFSFIFTAKVNCSHLISVKAFLLSTWAKIPTPYICKKKQIFL